MAQNKPQSYSPSELLTYVCNTELFKQSDELIQQELATNLKQVSLAKGAYLFHEGDPSNGGMYVVIQGHLQITITKKTGEQVVVGEQQAGDIVGEMGVLIWGKRTATVQALVETELVQISQATFDRLVEKNPQTLSQISEIMLQRIRRNRLTAIIPNILDSMGPEVLREVGEHVTWVHLRRGDQLMHQGEMGDTAYLLVNGRLNVVTEDAFGNEQFVGEIIEGEGVGEMQLLTGEPRSASVYAARDSHLVKIEAPVFHLITTKYPLVMRDIAHDMIKRLQTSIGAAPIRKSPLAIDVVVVPASPDVPVAEFIERLTAVLEMHGSTLILDRCRFDDYLGKVGAADIPEDSPNDIRLVTWLNEQESRYDFRIYQTDVEVTPWSKRCLRQADQILILADADSNPALSPIEAHLLRTTKRHRSIQQSLVLLHLRAKHIPQHTSRWLALRQAKRHHHINWHNEAHFRRLFRFIIGRPISLVLGGGGARGFAHVGILRALEEQGVEIDMIGGASFGALTAGLYALEYNYQKIEAYAKTLSHPKKVFDFTLPITSLFTSKKISRLFKELFGNVQLEDTWRPFFCVTTNLSLAEQIVHQTGPMWKYIRASTALPTIFSPIIEDGMVLMDGGVINNVPLDVMRNLNKTGIVIGVDVSVEKDLTNNDQFGDSLSGWKILWSHINPFIKPIKSPAIFSVTMRMAGLTSTRRRASQRDIADLFIHPPVERFGRLEVEAFEEIIEIGYQSSRQQIIDWLATNPLKR